MAFQSWCFELEPFGSSGNTGDVLLAEAFSVPDVMTMVKLFRTFAAFAVKRHFYLN